MFRSQPLSLLGVSPSPNYHQVLEFFDGLFFGNAVDKRDFAGQAIKR
jgi:hypothetical protein